MTEKGQTGTNTSCPCYKSVCLTEVSVKRELTVLLSLLLLNLYLVQLRNLIVHAYVSRTKCSNIIGS